MNKTDEMLLAEKNGWTNICPKCHHYKANTEYQISTNNGRKKHGGDKYKIEEHSLDNCPTHYTQGHQKELKTEEKEKKEKELSLKIVKLQNEGPSTLKNEIEEKIEKKTKNDFIKKLDDEPEIQIIETKKRKRECSNENKEIIIKKSFEVLKKCIKEAPDMVEDFLEIIQLISINN